MIIKIENIKQLKFAQQIIVRSFSTVAQEFGITKKNCPNHTSFITLKKLKKQYTDKRNMFLYVKDNKYIGYFSINKKDNGVYELDNLCVLPEFRHCSAGREMIKYAKKYVKDNLNGNKITIGIIDENAVLKKWYETLGFIYSGNKKFDNMPFTVGFMEMSL